MRDILSHWKEKKMTVYTVVRKEKIKVLSKWPRSVLVLNFLLEFWASLIIQNFWPPLYIMNILNSYSNNRLQFSSIAQHFCVVWIFIIFDVNLSFIISSSHFEGWTTWVNIACMLNKPDRLLKFSYGFLVCQQLWVWCWREVWLGFGKPVWGKKMCVFSTDSWSCRSVEWI